MYSFLLKKTDENFDWFTYGGRSLNITASVTLEKGAKFGVRQSSDPDMVRFTLASNDRVFLVPLEKARAIAKGTKR
jgi:hypothetical protein